VIIFFNHSQTNAFSTIVEITWDWIFEHNHIKKINVIHTLIVYLSTCIESFRILEFHHVGYFFPFMCDILRHKEQ